MSSRKRALSREEENQCWRMGSKIMASIPVLPSMVQQDYDAFASNRSLPRNMLDRERMGSNKQTLTESLINLLGNAIRNSTEIAANEQLIRDRTAVKAQRDQKQKLNQDRKRQSRLQKKEESIQEAKELLANLGQDLGEDLGGSDEDRKDAEMDALMYPDNEYESEHELDENVEEKVAPVRPPAPAPVRPPAPAPVRPPAPAPVRPPAPAPVRPPAPAPVPGHEAKESVAAFPRPGVFGMIQRIVSREEPTLDRMRKIARIAYHVRKLKPLEFNPTAEQTQALNGLDVHPEWLREAHSLEEVNQILAAVEALVNVT